MVADHETNAVLLSMAEKIGRLTASLEAHTSQWRQQDEKASQGRRDTHQKIDAMRAEMQKLDGQLTTAIKDIADMKPTVQTVKNAEQQVAGATWMSKWLYRAAILATGGAAWVVLKYLNITVALK
ncbi:Protein of unknown function (DUF1515) [Bradyrhizobium sp. YR681]|uniref:DUF1515 family protein n=1 Tax=Bradyrhizobium sp. YR681 TaxID=1144344 RepID=UPI00027114A2|nr:DUF1515 family protein [Bradyrhizobium sp. YR681]EJN11870.1 Protein of unknown function (DUF1515) [Bradyrhizobium sp. YR681]